MRNQNLDQLPDPDEGAIRFIFRATSVQTGGCWHFHGGPRSRMGDFYTGYCGVQGVRVSDAVAASSAFPPGFGALRYRLTDRRSIDRRDPWGNLREAPLETRDLENRLILLTNGGVYDNLGVEPIWDRCRTLLISNAGRPFSSMSTVRQSFGSRMLRVFDISAEQVGAVRQRWLIERFRERERATTLRNAFPEGDSGPDALDTLPRRAGTLWTIKTEPESFQPRWPEIHTYGFRRTDVWPRSAPI